MPDGRPAPSEIPAVLITRHGPVAAAVVAALAALRVLIPASPSGDRAALVWREGRLEALIQARRFNAGG